MATHSSFVGDGSDDDRWPVDDRAVRLAREAAARERLDIEVMTAPVLVISASGHIVAMNALAETLVGGHRSFLLGTPVRQVLRVPDLGGEPRDFRGQLFVEHVPAVRGAYVEHVAGELIPVDVLLCPDGDGTTVATCRVVSPDLDPVANRDDEVAAIGHDLKGPLCVISLELQAVRERCEATGVDPWLLRVGKNLDHADRLVNDLVDLASIDAARFALHRQRTDLSVLLAEVVDRMWCGGRVRQVAPPLDPAIVLADPLRIERVVGNLLQNALKYAPSPSPVIVTLEVDRTTATVSVIDQGPGIASEDASAIFDRFHRARSVQHHAGHGLGLYVSRKIIEAHGGVIGVDSTPGRGARFYFELPLALHS